MTDLELMQSVPEKLTRIIRAERAITDSMTNTENNTSIMKDDTKE